MKPPKDRKLTTLLKFQLKQQEKRIERCGNNAWTLHHLSKEQEEGTYFTNRPIRR